LIKRENLPLIGRAPQHQLPVPVGRKRELRRSRQTPVPLELLAPVRPDRDPHDREFLPAALEILEAPTSPTQIWLIYALCGLLATALAWSWFGHLDVYANAPGKIQAAGRTKVIQPLEQGTIISIRVKDGDRVKQGDVLLELDPIQLVADQAVVTNKLLSGRGEIARRQVSVREASKEQIDTNATIAWNAAIPQNVRDREGSALRSELSSLAAALALLTAQRKEKESERDKASAGVDAQKKVIALKSERVAMREKLAEQGWNSRAALIELLQGLRQAEVILTTLEGERANAIAQIAVLDTEFAKTRQTFISTNIQELVALDRQIEDLTHQLAKATAKVGHMTLKAPIDGTVQATAVTTIGQVVKSGQELMQVVPEGTPLEIQAYVLNTDIGFVSVGQEAIIKIHTFPFTRYGTISGTVTAVATDALPGKQGLQQQKNGSTPTPLDGMMSITTAAEQTQDLVYPITVVPSRSTMNVGTRIVPLTSGMTVLVEIKTESRRAINYILSPLASALATAAQER
jgi:hemolysin D